MFKETLTNAAPHAKSVIDTYARSHPRTHSKTICVWDSDYHTKTQDYTHAGKELEKESEAICVKV